MAFAAIVLVYCHVTSNAKGGVKTTISHTSWSVGHLERARWVWLPATYAVIVTVAGAALSEERTG